MNTKGKFGKRIHEYTFLQGVIYYKKAMLAKTRLDFKVKTEFACFTVMYLKDFPIF